MLPLENLPTDPLFFRLQQFCEDRAIAAYEDRKSSGSGKVHRPNLSYSKMRPHFAFFSAVPVVASHGEGQHWDRRLHRPRLVDNKLFPFCSLDSQGLRRRNIPTPGKELGAMPAKYHKSTRRSALVLLSGAMVALHQNVTRAEQFPKLGVPRYDANKSRRYVEIGRPPPERPPPVFGNGNNTFAIDSDLEAQDLRVGQSLKTVKPGTLAVARWVMLLDDGTVVDTTNEKQPAMFRAGTHLVPPGVEDAVVGMRAGGLRRVKGRAERILANVALGYDVGERSLVPNGSVLFIDITVDDVDPYGQDT